MAKSAHLDTHLIIWLYSGEISLVSSKVLEMLESSDLFYCPIAKLEIQYLKEIKRITKGPETIISSLKKEIGIKESKTPLSGLTDKSITLSWTRDPFDRLIVADAIISNSVLLTKDKTILRNYANALW